MSEQLEQVALVVIFGAGADSSAFHHVEPDEHLNVDAYGQVKNSFGPGDPYYFLLQWDALKLRLGVVGCSSGAVHRVGRVTRRHTIDDVQVIDAETSIELPHINAGAIGGLWCGNAPGIGLVGRKLSSHGALPARGQVSYSAPHELWRYVPPPAVSWRPMINKQWLVVITIRFDEAA